MEHPDNFPLQTLPGQSSQYQTQNLYQSQPQFDPPPQSYQSTPTSGIPTQFGSQYPPPPKVLDPYSGGYGGIGITQSPANPATPGEFRGAESTSEDDTGAFNGGSYRISHRDTNSLLTVQLAINCPLVVRPGAMVAMSRNVTLEGRVKFSIMKLLTRGSMTMSHYKGPGEVLLAPSMLGDITALRLSGQEEWMIGRSSFLAHTEDVKHEDVSQGLTKGAFSGVGFFVYKITGKGLLWMQSFGAIVKKELAGGERESDRETYFVDSGHVVAWNCKYEIRSVTSGGPISFLSASEGLSCEFKGPGTVYLQTRKMKAFLAQMNSKSGA